MEVWSLIPIDGSQYFCDPTFELDFDNGAHYQYFGQTYEHRLSDNLGSSGITAGRYYPYLVDGSLLAAIPLSH